MQQTTLYQNIAKKMNLQITTQRMMRPSLNTLLIILLAGSLAACGRGRDPEPPTPPTSIPIEVSEESEVAPAEEEAAEEAPAEDAATDEEAVEEEAPAEDVAEEAPAEEEEVAVDEEVVEEAAEEAPADDAATDEEAVEEEAPAEDAAEEAPAEEEEVAVDEEVVEEAAEEAPAEDATTDEEAVEEETSAEEATDDASDVVPAAEIAPADEEATEPRVFFVQPTDYAILPITSTIVMGVEGLVVEPAGEIRDGVGHLHILVDTDFIAPGEVIPNDDLHLHYGKGQLSAEVGLTPGEHTLRLQFANGAHIALEGDQYRAEINVTVTEDAAEQGVYFVSPQEGDTVSNPIEVIMAASGLVIEPAGDIRENAGHLHILVNTEFVAPGEVIVNDEIHLHYGKAQTETTLELEPGEYVLRLQLANGAHIALEGEEYQDEINIIVE